MSRIEWNGDAVAAKVSQACALGINETMALCVEGAKLEHEWVNRTGILEGSIAIARFAAAVNIVADAVPSTGEISGRWGSESVFYSIYQEIGTSVAGPTAMERVRENVGGMWDVAPQIRTHKDAPPEWTTTPARPYLRPQADIHYPLLANRIRVFYAALPKV